MPYAGYLSQGAVPFIEPFVDDVRGMAGIALVLGLVAFAVLGPPTRPGVGLLGLASLALGIAAIWVETSELLLAAFVVSVVAVWAVQTPSDRGGPERNLPKPG